MGWRRRSGNLIALRAEEAREERRQTCAAGLALRRPRPRPRPCPTHTMSPASGNPRFYSCDTRSDMSNDPVPCALCNCVMVVKNVSDEGFSLFVQDCSWAADSAPGGLGASQHMGINLITGISALFWWSYSRFSAHGWYGWTFTTSTGKLPTLETRRREGKREVERSHYDYSLGLLPVDKAFVFTSKYDLFFHHSQGLCLSLHTERIFFRNNGRKQK